LKIDIYSTIPQTIIVRIRDRIYISLGLVGK